MHERTRKRLLAAAFGLLCLLPTLAVSAWAVWHQFPWHTSLLEQRLSRQLGVDIQLREVSYPRPRQVRLLGVAACDPETKLPFLQAHSLELTHTLEGLVLVASQPSFDMAYSHQIWEWLDHSVLRHDVVGEGQMAIRAEELTLRGDGSEQLLEQVACHWKPNPAGPQARVTFKLAEQGEKPPTQLRVERNRQITPPATFVELQSSAPLPCALLGGRIGSLTGPAASLQGTIAGKQTPSGWLVAIDNARLNDVQLEHLMQAYAHRLTGKATVLIQQAELGGGRLLRARGSMIAGPGKVGKSLLLSARDAMQLTTGSHLQSPPGATLPYQQLAFHFDIQEDGPRGGLQVLGACHEITPSLPKGTIMANKQGDLMRQPAIQPLSVLSLAGALAPSSEFHLPAAPEIGMLLSVLPMTPIVASVERDPAPVVRQATGNVHHHR